MCTSAGTSVVLDCSDGSCAPCADEISFMFSRYASLLDTTTTKLYTKIASVQAGILQSSNAYNDIAKKFAPRSKETAVIKMPAGARA